MLELGAALIGGGLYWWFLTTFPAKSQEDVEKALEIEADNRKTFGFFADWVNTDSWASRKTYEHPVLMRLPWIISVGAGALLIAIELAG